MQPGLRAKELERPHPDFLVATIGVHQSISRSVRRQVNGYRLLREPRDLELARAGHEHCLVDQLLVSSEQRVNDRLHPGPLLIPGEPSGGAQDDEARVELDRSRQEEEVGGVDRHHDLVVVEGLSPHVRVGRARQSDVSDVDRRNALRGEALYERWAQVLVDEEVHPSPRTNLGFFLGRPGGRPSATNIRANSMSSEFSAG